MAKQLLIKAKARENKKPNALRASGFIPATLYGHGMESKSIELNAKEFSKIPHKAYSHINLLDLEGDSKYDVLIKNVQIDPVKDCFLNIEFHKIRSDEKVKIKIPIKYTGHSPAVTAGGVLIVSYNEVEAQCLPKDIPDEIEIQLEDIKEIGQAIHMKDLKINPAVTLLQHADEVVAKVEIPKTHIVEEEKPVVAEAVTAEGAAAPLAEGAPAASPGAKAPPAGKEAQAPAKEEPKAKGKQEPKK